MRPLWSTELGRSLASPEVSFEQEDTLSFGRSCLLVVPRPFGPGDSTDPSRQRDPGRPRHPLHAPALTSISRSAAVSGSSPEPREGRPPAEAGAGAGGQSQNGKGLAPCAQPGRAKPCFSRVPATADWSSALGRELGVGQMNKGTIVGGGIGWKTQKL